MLPGFDDIVADMDINLLTPGTGFGTKITFVSGNEKIDINAFICDSDPENTIGRNNNRAINIHRNSSIRLHVNTRDLFADCENYTTTINSKKYAIATLYPLDNSITEIILTASSSEMKKHGQWLRGVD